VTKIIVRLLPLPESVRTLAAFFPDVAGAASAVSGISTGRVVPRTLELVDSGAIRAVENYLKLDVSGGAAAMLLLEVDGPELSSARDIETLEGLCRTAGATSITRAATKEEQDHLWKFRRAISPALCTIKPNKLNEDIVVPPSRIPEILAETQEIAKRYDLLIVNFGHAGDGNIHTNIMFDEPDRPRAEEAVKEIFGAVLRLQGSISGEHGIGLSKAKYLPMEAGEASLEVMKKIKQALDPNNILNPGKIFLDKA